LGAAADDEEVAARLLRRRGWSRRREREPCECSGQESNLQGVAPEGF
jgi:hypothetical protein